MNKCLVTKLNGSVHDDTLPLLGYQQFVFSLSEKGNSEELQLPSLNGVKSIKLVGDGYFINAEGGSLGKETTSSIKGIHSNTSGSFIIKIPNNFRNGAVSSIRLGITNLILEEVTVEQLLKILGTSQETYPEFYIRSNTISGDITKLINFWGIGSFYLNLVEESKDAYGNLDDVVFYGESTNELYAYNFHITNIPRLTGNLETLLDKFAQHANYGSSPIAHDMIFTLVGCPLVKYKGKCIGDNFVKTFTIQVNNTWTEK